MMAKTLVVESWDHAMESTFGGLRVVPLTASSDLATGTFASTDLGEVGVFGISGTPQQLVRSSRSVRDSPIESVKVCAVNSGRCVIEQSGFQVEVRPGHFAVYDTSLPYQITWKGNWECDVMTASLMALGVPRAVFDVARSKTWSTADGPGSALLQFMTTCTSMPSPVPAARSHLASAATSLLAGAILNDAELLADQAGTVLQGQIKSYVDRFLHHPELCLSSIAAAHHVSVRTVQRLFAGTGTGLSSLIRQRRLEAIRRDLGDSGLAHLTIAQLAARWCVHDAQWLAKAFKAEFGISPSEFRRSPTAEDH